MLRRFLYGITVFVLAFAILSISFFQSASVKYAFALAPTTPTPIPDAELKSINYQLPYPGSILPDSPLWSLKAFRDQLWFWLTTSPTKRAELALLFADKRLAMSQTLFSEKKASIAFSTLTKAEKYLETSSRLEGDARKSGVKTADLLQNITLSSLKHRQVIEQILTIAPEDAKPGIIKLESYSRDVYIRGREGLSATGRLVPINPFNGQ